MTKEKIDKQTIHKAGLNLKSRENLEFCFCRKMWRTPKLGILNDHPVQGRDAVLPRTTDTHNEGINQRNLKIWAYVADKKCFGRT